MQSSKRLIAAAVFAVVGQWAVSSTTFAVDRTWDGGGATDELNLAANWAGDVLPTAADRAIFTGTEGLSPTATAPTQYLGLVFDAAAGGFTFGGSALTLGASPTTAGPITNNSLVTQTFNNAVGTYGGIVTNSVATGALVFNGTFNIGMGGAAGGNNVFFTGIGTTTLNGGIVGNGAIATGGALVKQGAGTLIINADAAATFAAGNEIQGGILRIGAGGALGSGRTIVRTAGGTLELSNNITFNHNLIMDGRASGALAHINNFSGNNTIGTVVGTVGGGFHNFSSAAGLLTINNYEIAAAVASARNITLGGAGDGRINAWNPVTTNLNHNVIKSGTGTWTLGTDMNLSPTGSFGNITLNANGGTLVMEGGLGERVRGNTLVSTGSTLRLGSANGFNGEVGTGSPAGSLTIQAGGTLDALAFTQYSLQPAQTLVGGGTFKVGGDLRTFGDNAVHIGNSAAPAAGTFNIEGNLSLSNLDATPTGGLRFDLGSTTTVGGGVNDLISIQGDLLVNNGGGAIPLYVTPLTGALATGTYRLIDFTSGSTPNASDFTIVGSSAGTTRQTLGVGTAAGQVNLVVSGTNANLIWAGDGAGNAWDVLGANNFRNNGTPDKFYQFDNVSFTDASLNQTVNLTGELLPGSVTVDSTKDYVFQGSGFIGGVTGLTKSGTGSLTIANSGVNTFTGPIAINGGTLQIGNGGADGNIGAGTLTNNGTLVLNKSTDVALGVMSGTGSLIKRGTGNVALNQAHTYSGLTTIESGTAFVSNNTGLGDATSGTVVLAGAQVYSTAANVLAEALTLNGDGPTAGIGALRVGGSAISTFNGPITLGSATTIRGDGSGAQGIFNGTVTGANANLTLIGDGGGTLRFANTISLGSGQLIKEGPSLVILQGTDHSWTGGTTVNGGTLQLGNAEFVGNIPTSGTFTLATAGTLSFGSNQEITFSNALTSAGTIAQAPNGGITHLTGDLTGFTGTLVALDSATANIANVTSVLDVATQTNAVTATVADFTNQGRGAGVVRLSNNQALAPNATINIQAQQGPGTGRLELNNVNISVGAININQRANETATIRSIAGNNTLTSTGITITTGGASVNLEADAGTTFTLNGPINPNAGSNRNLALQGAGIGTVTGVIGNNPTNAAVGINVLKRGTGTWTLTGANTTIGTNIVQAGTLVYGTAAQTPVFGTGAQGIDIQGGKAAFQYADSGSGATLAESVRAILDGGYDQTPNRFATGTIRSTTVLAQGNRTLGWRNNTAASQVEVAYTLPGDTNLDFSTNFADLVALAQNYNQTGRVWSQGDFNYDQSTNFADLVLLAQNYNQSALTPAQASLVGESFAGEFALAQTMVPEPAALSVLALGMLSFARRQRAGAKA